MSPNDPNNPSNQNSNDPLNFDDDDMLAADNRLNDDGEDEPPKGVSLGEIWRNNPSLKIFAVVLVIGIFLIVFLVFGGEEEANPSAVGGASGVTQPPGTAQLPPAYEDAVKSASEQRAVSAEMNGGSAIPTPIGTAERIEAPPVVENVDPLAEWRRAAEERASQRRETEQVSLPTPPVDVNALQQPQQVVQQTTVQQVPAGPPPLPTEPEKTGVDSQAQRLSDYMKAIVESQTPRESTLVSLSGVPTGFEMPKEPDAQQLAQQAAQQATTDAQAQANKPPKVIIPAGTIAYAQTLIESNSDVPGPILAELASGPLSGARLLGAFQTQDEYMVLQFNRAVYKGKEYRIDAYALDPATTLPGLATDVNHHYMRRILIPAAARFIQGYANAISQRGTTVIVNDSSTIAATGDLSGRQSAYLGAAEAANQASTVVQQDANKPITVKVAAGTRMGLLFTSSLTDEDGDPNLARTPAYQQEQEAARNYAGQRQQTTRGLNDNYGDTISSSGPADSYMPVQGSVTRYGNSTGYNNGSYGPNYGTTYPNTSQQGYYPNNTRVITTGTPIR